MVESFWGRITERRHPPWQNPTTPMEVAISPDQHRYQHPLATQCLSTLLQTYTISELTRLRALGAVLHPRVMSTCSRKPARPRAQLLPGLLSVPGSGSPFYSPISSHRLLSVRCSMVFHVAQTYITITAVDIHCFCRSVRSFLPSDLVSVQTRCRKGNTARAD